MQEYMLIFLFLLIANVLLQRRFIDVLHAISRLQFLQG
jgi:hypothetical protein